MTQVMVTGIDGNKICCSDGAVRSAIGNSRVCIGDILWSNGDCVFSPGQPAGRAPIVWRDSPMHFADSNALKMLYPDGNFSNVIKVKDLNLPDANAKLLLHCYNRWFEYFVWIWEPDSGNCRCLIQKNGVTLADFMSVFTNQPVYMDSYIDAGGGLRWAALDQSGKVLGTYAGGELMSSFEYSTDGLTTAFETYAVGLMSVAAAVAADTVGDESTVIDNYLLLGPRNAYLGTISERHYTGLNNTVDSVSASISGIIYDLWNRAIVADVRATVYAHIGARFQVLSRNHVTGDVVDTSHTAPLASPYLDVNRYYKQSSGGTTVLCDYAAIDSQTGSMSAVTELAVISSKNSDVAVSGYVHAVENAGAFTGNLTLPGGIDGWYAGAGIYGCTITFTSGANAGQSRTINNYGNMTSVTPILVSAPFDNVVSVSDTFTIEMALIDVESTATTATISVAVPFDNVSQTVCTEATEIDIGNGYKLVQKVADMNPEGQAVHMEPSIKYEGETIYTHENPYEYLVDGAWSTSAGKLTGVLPAKTRLLTAAESLYTTKEINVLPSGIVTKRFA